MSSYKIGQRKDGRYYSTLQVFGVRKFVYGKTREEVKKKLEALRATAIQSGRLPNDGKRTVNHLLDAWYDALLPTLKPSTAAMYKAVCDKHVRPYIGHIKLSKLEPYHIQSLCSKIQETSKRQPKLAFNRIHHALKMAVMWGWLPYNPADRVIRPKSVQKRKELWTEVELQTFIAGIQGHNMESFILMLIFTGCRFGELVGLRWSDVDWQNNSLTISRNLLQVNGKWVEGEPKTKAGMRHISLPPEGMRILRRQKALQEKQEITTEWTKAGLVFTTKRGNPIYRAGICRELQKDCRRLSIPLLTAHGLRHLHATLLLSKGLPVPAVSARLGHANPSITLAVYAHAVQKQDEEAATAIGLLMEKKQ